MTNEGLTDGHIELIVDALEERLARKALQGIVEVNGAERAPCSPTQNPAHSASKYNKQLHIWLAEEDKEWFYNTARSNNLKSGAFMSYLRSLHEAQQFVERI